MRAWPLFGIVTVVALAAPDALALDTQACLAASEKGQRARAAGRLREARDQFNVCGSDACPAIVRRDCAEWQVELVAAVPTVVFGARDRAGRDLFDVTVSMDGEIVAKTLDGKAVPVDPGPHTFKFQVTGLAPVVEKTLVKEGEKARSLTVTFDSGDPGPGRAGAGTGTRAAAGAGPGPATPPDEPARGHTVFPWILTGAGAVTVIVGVIVAATAPARPANCSKSSGTCTRTPPTETDDQLQSDRDRAGKADAQPVVGIGVAAVGGVAIAGGLLWHFLEPTGAPRAGVRISPSLGNGVSGVEIGGRF